MTTNVLNFKTYLNHLKNSSLTVWLFSYQLKYLVALLMFIIQTLLALNLTLELLYAFFVGYASYKKAYKCFTSDQKVLLEYVCFFFGKLQFLAKSFQGETPKVEEFFCNTSHILNIIDYEIMSFNSLSQVQRVLLEGEKYYRLT